MGEYLLPWVTLLLGLSVLLNVAMLRDWTSDILATLIRIAEALEPSEESERDG